MRYGNVPPVELTHKNLAASLGDDLCSHVHYVQVGMLHDEGRVGLDLRWCQPLKLSSLRIKDDWVEALALSSLRGVGEDRLVSVAAEEEQGLLLPLGDGIGDVRDWRHGDQGSVSTQLSGLMWCDSLRDIKAFYRSPDTPTLPTATRDM